jgi:hypothetical protein
VMINAQKISLRRVSGNNFRYSDHGVDSLEYISKDTMYTLTT